LLLLGGTDPKIFSLAPLANYFVPPNLKTVAPPLHVGNGWQIMHIHFGKIWAKIHVTGTKKPLSTIE